MDKIPAPEDLSNEKKVEFIFDMFHRIVAHYGLWFTEVKHQMGMEKALDSVTNVFERSFGIQMKRMSKVLGFELENGYPKALLDKSGEELTEIMNSIAINWLANDGVWFQEIESTSGMTDAKRCNDSCWGQFSPFEARSIKKFLELGENPGLEGLKKALDYRLYGRINKQSFSNETEKSFVFEMNECRVQFARNRKGLDDYPCKSGGMVEYPYFAKEIDSRIKTECVGCPPDPHPETWFCAWRFYIED